MKTCFLVIQLSSAFACSCFSQGTINFANDQNSLARIGFSLTDPTAMLLAAPAYAQLFAAPAGTAFTPLARGMPGGEFLAANPAWARFGAPVLIGRVQPGLFDGGPVTISNIAAGAPAEVAILVWYGNYSSFDAAIASHGLIGSSDKMHFDATGTPANPVPLVQAQGLNGPFIYNLLPEPSAGALGLLGAFAWLIRQRKWSRRTGT